MTNLEQFLYDHHLTAWCECFCGAKLARGFEEEAWSKHVAEELKNREPQPEDGPDYHEDHAAWERRVFRSIAPKEWNCFIWQEGNPYTGDLDPADAMRLIKLILGTHKQGNIPAAKSDPRLRDLPNNPEALLSEQDKEDLKKALANIAKNRRQTRDR